MNTEPKLKGRPKGANSFTTLTLAELNQRFKPEDSIMVGRLFLEKGVIGAKPQNPFSPPNNKVETEETTGPAIPSSMVGMTLQP